MKINVQATLELINALEKQSSLQQPSFEDAQFLAKYLGSFCSKPLILSLVMMVVSLA